MPREADSHEAAAARGMEMEMEMALDLAVHSRWYPSSHPSWTEYDIGLEDLLIHLWG